MPLPDPWIIILTHQILFQGIFIAKNIALGNKLGVQIRGKNAEAQIATWIFALFIIASLVISIFDPTSTQIQIISQPTATLTALILLTINLAIAIASLLHLKDSWRVGVVETQKTELITTGIYAISRNPYFVSYIILFIAYTILLQNPILATLGLVATFFLHKMIRKEEQYLQSVHGQTYETYRQSVPRYLLV